MEYVSIMFHLSNIKIINLKAKDFFPFPEFEIKQRG
jgi:hypothetical protein